MAKERISLKSNNLYEPKLIRADSTNLKGIVPDNCIDFIFAHPPYANIIKYSKDIKEDLSRLELNEFLDQTGFTLKEIIIKEQHNCKRTGYWSQNINRDFYLLAHEYIFILEL